MSDQAMDLGVDSSSQAKSLALLEARKRRRLGQAEKLRLVNLAQHYGPTAAARELGLGRNTAYYWLKRYEEGGSQALLRPKPRGKQEVRTLTSEVKERLFALKRENPQRSSAKVARLYEVESGQRVHRTTVWALLKKGGKPSSP